MLARFFSKKSHRNADRTVPHVANPRYRTGKTIRDGAYGAVKEVVHIETGKYYACKVINKKLVEEREHLVIDRVMIVLNEIAVRKKVSGGHKNIVNLYDYFETATNVYIVLDLCTGGELFDRIRAKGNYYEADAAELVHTILLAVQHIHDAGIVHRNLKAENLLFRTKAEDADIMITGFGLARVLDDDKFTLFTDVCGTLGYMAPETLKRAGHHKPVDIWAVGVMTYFMLCGYTPFDRDTQQSETEAIIRGGYRFGPVEYWANISETAKDFVRYCLTIDPSKRPTAAQALEHKWVADAQQHFDARKTFRKAAFAIIAIYRLSAMSGRMPQLALDIGQHQEYAEEVGNPTGSGVTVISRKMDFSGGLDLSSFGEYPISHGGFSDIYQGRLRDGTSVAVKALRVSVDNISKDPKHLKHAARELHTWGRCKHPNVMPLLGLAIFRDRIGMVAPWMGHGSLPRYLDGVPGVNRFNLCVQICEGLSCLPQIGIIHCDLKGENVLVSDEGTPFLTDFGTSLLLDRTLGFTQMTNRPAFTVRWSPAEIIEETSPHTEASDVYALGMTIYETITGKVPYQGKGESNVIRLVTVKGESPEQPECMSSDDQSGGNLWNLLVRCWSFEPSARPSVIEVTTA
ncbi:hypothetical protein FRC11_007615, partial [Ceratobasidium sp. 423]